MSSFEFLSVLISVVVGLAIANMLNGIGRLIYRLKEFKLSVRFVAWTVFLFLHLVIYRWTIVFGWQESQTWNLLIFLFVMIYGVVLFLLSVVLLPAELPPLLRSPLQPLCPERPAYTDPAPAARYSCRWRP